MEKSNLSKISGKQDVYDLILEHCGSQQCCRFVWKDFWLACLV